MNGDDRGVMYGGARGVMYGGACGVIVNKAFMWRFDTKMFATLLKYQEVFPFFLKSFYTRINWNVIIY